MQFLSMGIQIEHKCEECNKFFSTVFSLRQHKQSQHELIIFECDKCEYETKAKTNLNRHIETIHEGERYNCEFCEWKGLYPEALRIHIKGEHGENTFIAYELKNKIKLHVKLEARKEGDICPICFKQLKSNQLKKAFKPS